VKPRLHLDVDQTELAVEEVEIQVQAFAPGKPCERMRVLPDQGEGAARLEHGEHTDQALCDAVTLGNLSREILLAGRAAEILVRTPG
jgi:hypothetical protein